MLVNDVFKCCYCSSSKMIAFLGFASYDTVFLEKLIACMKMHIYNIMFD